MSILQSIPAPLGYANVSWNEQDLSQTVSPASAVTFAALINAQDGPVNQIQTFTGKDTYVSIFDTPTDTNYNEWFQVYRAFLYKNGPVTPTAKVVRVVGDGSLNGALGLTTTSVVNQTDLTTQRIDNDEQVPLATITFDTNSVANTGDDTISKLKFYTKYPTENVYKIALCNASDFSTALIKTGVNFVNEFTETPTGTELAIAVLDSTDTIIETLIVDMTPGNVDGYNLDTYIENKINNTSKYLLCYVNEAVAGVPFSIEATPLTKGALVTPVAADYITGLGYFDNSDTVDINYIIGHPLVIDEMITLCESRKDCSMRWSPEPSMLVGKDIATAVTDLTTYTGTTLNRNTTFASFYANCALVYDEYNKKPRWISISGDVVGLRILKNLQANPWFAAAGPNQVLKDIIRLAINPNPNYQIILNANKANSVISKAGVGNIIMWNNNYTSVKSELQLEPTRELLVYIWRANKSFLFFKLFEQNDDITRGLITSQLEQFMGSVEAGRGIEANFQVICNSENNTPAIINQQRLICTIVFTPINAVREIVLQAVVSSSGLDVTGIL